MVCPMEGKAPSSTDRGRPTAYKATYAKQAEKLCLLGATDQEIADFLEIDVRTLYRWKHTHDDFCQALIVGKETADDRVERSLFQRAIGYEQDEVKIFMPSGAESPVYAPFRAKIAADVGAAKLWLTNRRGDKWRDVSRTELEAVGDLAAVIAERRAKVAKLNGQ